MPGWIVFQVRSDTGSETVLHLIRTDGTDDHQIATDVPPAQKGLAEDHVIPEWSPDGTRLVFTRYRSGPDRRDLFEYDVATGTSRELVHCDDPCVDATEAAFSPDSSELVYFFAEGAPDAEGIPADCGLRILTMATGKARDLTSSACGLVEERFPDWSPDGARIAFLRTHQDVRGGPWVKTEIVIRDVASGTETVVGEPGLDADELDWSPDGGGIAIVTARHLDVFDVATSERRTIVDLDTAETGYDTSTDVVRHPRFTPDGSAILFAISQTDGAGTAIRRDLWVTALDGSAIHEVFPDGTAKNERGFYTRASLQPVP
jgi:Tol biopolymer transport system component